MGIDASFKESITNDNYIVRGAQREGEMVQMLNNRQNNDCLKSCQNLLGSTVNHAYEPNLENWL